MLKQFILLLLLTFSTKATGYHLLAAMVNAQNFEKDIYKAKLIASLEKEKDIIIYDIDYNNQVSIAVGEDNSIETRKEKSKDEYYLGITLYSFDGGKHWEKSLGGDIPMRRVIVLDGHKAIAIGSMEGAGGFVKMTNNAGEEWKIVYKGAFLNDITQHSNGFFAVGNGILYSKQGKQWHTVLEEKAYEFTAILSVDKKRLILASPHQLFYSQDNAMSWQKAKVPSAIEYAWLRYLYKDGKKLYTLPNDLTGFKLRSTDNGIIWQNVSTSKTNK